MDTQLDHQLNNCLKQLNDIEKKSILLMLKIFLQRRETTGITIEKYNKEIDEALAEVAEGKFISQEEMEIISQEEMEMCASEW